MKTISTFAVILSTILLTSCMGGSSGGGGSSSPAPYTYTLSDQSIDTGTLFVNGSQVAHQRSLIDNLSNFFIQTAYASVANQDISCEVPEQVTIGMDIMTTPVSFQVSCGPTIGSQIRAGMLESMAGKSIRMEYAGGSDQLLEDRIITFRDSSGPGAAGAGVDVLENGFFGIYNDIYANGKNLLCREYFKFQEDGNVVSGLDEVNTTAKADAFALANGGYPILIGGDYNHSVLVSFANAQLVVDDCLDGDTSGDFKTTAFRFKDGYLEMDSEGTDFNDGYNVSSANHKKLIDYNRYCIDDNADQACDGASIPGGYVALPTVCHIQDYANLDGSNDPQYDTLDADADGDTTERLRNCAGGSVIPWSFATLQEEIDYTLAN